MSVRWERKNRCHNTKKVEEMLRIAKRSHELTGEILGLQTDDIVPPVYHAARMASCVVERFAASHARAAFPPFLGWAVWENL
jgi:hypothetical protein